MALADGLPKVDGLADFVQANLAPDNADKDQTQTVVTEPQGEPPAQQQAQTPPDGGQVTDDLDWGQFKNPKDLLKSYKEIQGFTTRVSQENKQLKDEMQRLKEDAEIRQYQTPPVAPQGNKTFEELFIENPEQAITVKAMEIANTQRITEVLEDKRLENPGDFQERVAYVQMLAQQPQYKQLSFSPKGVSKLFEIADRTRTEMLTKKAHESLKVLFGDDVDLEKLKALARKDGTQTTNNQPTTANPLNAYMPNTGTSTRTGADVNMHVNDLERQKHEAIATGDASTVAGVLIRQALSK